jgi:hypothetical protein
MSSERFEFFTALAIPKFDSFIVASTCNSLAVRAEGDAIDPVFMSSERFD